MSGHDVTQYPLHQGDAALRHGQELTANSSSAVSDSRTSGLTGPQPVRSASSADMDQPLAGTATHPGTVAAVSKVRLPDQVERSQGSFAALNKLLHSFTSGSPKALKKEDKKGSALTDAQVQQYHCMLWAIPLTLQTLSLAISPMQ